MDLCCSQIAHVPFPLGLVEASNQPARQLITADESNWLSLARLKAFKRSPIKRAVRHFWSPLRNFHALNSRTRWTNTIIHVWDISRPLD